MPRDNAVEGRGRPGGFTFIELLATVVLIGIIMPVAMGSIGLCTRLGGQSRRQIEAACLANTKLTELRAIGRTGTSGASLKMIGLIFNGGPRSSVGPMRPCGSLT